MSTVVSPLKVKPGAPVQPGVWRPDGEAPSCQSCRTGFSLVTRRHHCRGCGLVFCGSCMTESSLEQYGALSPQPSCKQCAAPYIICDSSEVVLPTAGGDVLLQCFNAGSSNVTVTFDAADVPAEFVRASSGLRLRVTIGPGTGTKDLVVRSPATGLEGRAKLNYNSPSILRVGELKTEGGDLTLFCENVGSGDVPVKVSIDGQACDNVTVTQPHKKLACRAPPGVGVATVRVEVDNQAAETDVLRAAPEVIAVEPREISAIGGPVVFRGGNFGTDPSRVQVLLPEHGAEAVEVSILEPHSRLECVMPPMPETARAGENVRVRIIVAGVHSIAPIYVSYNPHARPAKLHAHASGTPIPGKDAPNTASPYAALFTTPLPVEPKRSGAAAARSMASPQAAPSGPAETPTSLAKKQPAMVRVGGTIAGGGPTLSITPPRNWQEDTPECSICNKGFGISRRRHHCRICGTCACATCTAFQLQLAPTKPAVRVCTRCHLRVGVLSQMVSIIDAIQALRRVLPHEMYDTFKDEVIDAVTVPLDAKPVPGTPAKDAGQAKSTPVQAKSTPVQAKSTPGKATPAKDKEAAATPARPATATKSS